MILSEPTQAQGNSELDHLIQSISTSVQDLLDAPAAEEEIEALLNRLD